MITNKKSVEIGLLSACELVKRLNRPRFMPIITQHCITGYLLDLSHLIADLLESAEEYQESHK